ncbi:MAG: hypothetical protein KKD17_05170 [Nanoarchaeota archaeon]|nr:hypothetical protein [Nanoarchaeota archaeon]
MDHLAILSKRLNLLSRILSGEKTIESRWYKFPKTPFRSIAAGDTVYFKESGCPVSAKAKVDNALFFAELDKGVFDDIVVKYGPRICISQSYWQHVKDKRLCTLIFLKDVKKIPPFQIDKAGYGNMAAWITLDSIDRIRRSS